MSLGIRKLIQPQRLSVADCIASFAEDEEVLITNTTHDFAARKINDHAPLEAHFYEWAAANAKLPRDFLDIAQLNETTIYLCPAILAQIMYDVNYTIEIGTYNKSANSTDWQFYDGNASGHYVSVSYPFSPKKLPIKVDFKELYQANVAEIDHCEKEFGEKHYSVFVEFDQRLTKKLLDEIRPTFIQHLRSEITSRYGFLRQWRNLSWRGDITPEIQKAYLPIILYRYSYKRKRYETMVPLFNCEFSYGKFPKRILA